MAHDWQLSFRRLPHRQSPLCKGIVWLSFLPSSERVPARAISSRLCRLRVDLSEVAIRSPLGRVTRLVDASGSTVLSSDPLHSTPRLAFTCSVVVPCASCCYGHDTAAAWTPDTLWVTEAHQSHVARHTETPQWLKCSCRLLPSPQSGHQSSNVVSCQWAAALPWVSISLDLVSWPLVTVARVQQAAGRRARPLQLASATCQCSAFEWITVLTRSAPSCSFFEATAQSYHAAESPTGKELRLLATVTDD